MAKRTSFYSVFYSACVSSWAIRVTRESRAPDTPEGRRFCRFIAQPPPPSMFSWSTTRSTTVLHENSQSNGTEVKTPRAALLMSVYLCWCLSVGNKTMKWTEKKDCQVYSLCECLWYMASPTYKNKWPSLAGSLKRSADGPRIGLALLSMHTYTRYSLFNSSSSVSSTFSNNIQKKLYKIYCSSTTVADHFN